jgi:type II secretion system protein C
MRATGYRRYLALINSLLVVTAASLLFKAGFILLDPPDSGTASVMDVAGDIDAQRIPAREDYEVIARRNIFVEPVPPVSNPVPAQTVRVKADEDVIAKNLKLVGTIAGDEEYACAIIEDGKGTQGIYGRGERVIGAEIVEVSRNRVVLRKGDTRQVLYAYTDNDIMSEGSRAMASAGKEPLYEKTATRTWRVNPGRVLAEYGDVNDLMGQVHFRPRIENGRFAGLTVSELADKSIFSDLGIQSNDIIRAINGKPVTGMKRAYDLIKDVSNAQLASIDVVREGQPLILRYHLEK